MNLQYLIENSFFFSFLIKKKIKKRKIVNVDLETKQTKKKAERIY